MISIKLANQMKALRPNVQEKTLRQRLHPAEQGVPSAVE